MTSRGIQPREDSAAPEQLQQGRIDGQRPLSHMLLTPSSPPHGTCVGKDAPQLRQSSPGQATPDEGYEVGRFTVHRLMKQAGVQGYRVQYEWKGGLPGPCGSGAVFFAA